ncbi:hypothetical protein B9Z19DRAFT_1062392 [Tuber borchii]|uniref:Uncharacterized protein n=1 Tax=Tuber borchii TaxID=42251 RepID=A0A2T7A210_TUBBO|nr:hypothetical protein B9Z19DRAFT_1062392 [Tuber borchii]
MAFQQGEILKQIVPPPPDTQFSGDFLAILNQYTQDNGTTEVTEKYLSKEYHGKRELPSASKVGLKASVHCECSLALASAKSHLSSPVPTILVIGISKYTCSLCHQFLATCHDSYPHITIHVPACSSKLRSGWTLPPGAPSKVVNAMRRQLQDVVKQVLTESVRTLTADSDACADDSSSDEFRVDYSDEDFHDYFNDDSDND